jgi:hypothetical protein
MYWIPALLGAMALIDISLELTKIRKALEARTESTRSQ